MSKRLVKVAKELNVGTTTIVEHLTKNGFELENRPTAKVSDEMYNVLLRDFEKSIAIKERADKLTIGSRQRKEAEAAAREKDRLAKEKDRLAKEKERKALEEEKKALLEARKKEESARLAVEREKARKDAEAKEKENRKLAGVKVISKVDLDKRGNVINKKEKSSKETPVAKTEGRNKGKAPITPTVESKSTFKVKETSQSPIQNKDASKVETTTNEDGPKVGGDGTFRAKTPELKGLKIKGKIDLNKFSKKPVKKEDDGKNKKRGDGGNRRNRRRGEKSITPKDNLPENKTATTPETGTDEENKDRKRQPIASSDDAGAKKRKRKRKKIIPPELPVGGGNNDGPDNQRGPVGGGDRRRRRGAIRPTAKSNEPKEVSKKEIEDKIKATMARLSGGGKNKRSKLRRDNRERMREKEAQVEADNHTDKLQVSELISVSELASVMNVSITDVITTCMSAGVIVSINQRLDAEIIELVAGEYGHEVEFISAEVELEEEDEFEDDPKDIVDRAPVVTVMGHVDHGKTSLLDYIRKANVADGEAGGITQHIGAYEVKVGEDNKKITFLDTPGHEAFTAMRARGAKVTDIAVIIVSADDSVMPQTKEAISHAQAAGVPIIFAINKIDKPGANPERIKQELSTMNLLVEEWGGKYQSQDISAKKGTNIDELLEKILLEAELLELKANPVRPAMGVVLEASLDKGRGYVTKILVQNGTLNVKDPIVGGAHSGRIRAMFNERGKRIKKAGPATPVLILGLNGAPQAGEKFKAMESEQAAKSLASKREQIAREQQQRAMKRVSLDDINRRRLLGNFKELNLIIKGDVDGSIEALADSLLKQSVETVQVKIVHRAVGPIKDSDILLASASDAIIIGFQVRPSSNAKALAEKEGVEIKMYSVIYDAIEEIRSAIEGLLEPKREEKQVAEVEVRDVFKISKVGTVAGCYVKEGKIARNSKIRVIREGIVVYPKKEGVVGELSSLKRFKDDAKDVKFGFECGLTIVNYTDMKPGDIIEAYEVIEIKQTLDNHNKITTA
jgi:translation initiation factor IF-2